MQYPPLVYNFNANGHILRLPAQRIHTFLHAPHNHIVFKHATTAAPTKKIEITAIGNTTLLLCVAILSHLPFVVVVVHTIFSNGDERLAGLPYLT